MKQLSSVTLPKNWNLAIASGYDLIDELLGNCGGVFGAREGKLILFSANSGTGKTRLMLALGRAMTDFSVNKYNEAVKLLKKILPDVVNYGHFTGEQSEVALAIMGKTMDMEFSEYMLADTETYWPSIEQKIIEFNLKVVVIDSLPMLQFPKNFDKNKPMDTKERIQMIARFAEAHNVVIILLNHTDKKGNFAGRNELKHLVDVAYTLRMVNRADQYDGVKVVEFHNDKHREGCPVERAFPFNGVWDFETAYDLEGASGNDGGANNGTKVEARKAGQRKALMDILTDMGKIKRVDIESGDIAIPGMAKSGIYALLRTLVDEEEVIVEREKAGGRGQPAINAWMLPVVETKAAKKSTSKKKK